MKKWKEELREKRLILVLFSIALFLIASSCGKKGDPIPKGSPVPENISDLTGEVKDGVLFLSFSIPKKNKDGSDIKNLEGFKVFKSCGGCLGSYDLFRDIKMDSKKGFTEHGGRIYLFDDDLVKGFQYTYKVFAYTKAMVRANTSNTFTIKWDATPPPPKGLKAREDDETVELAWLKEDGFLYNIYRHDKDIYPLFPLNNKPLATTMFKDTGLDNNRQYRYDVRAVLQKDGILWEGEGAKVDAVPKDQTPPAMPLEVKAEQKDKGIAITWKEGKEKDIKGYNIYRINGSKTEKLNEEPIKGNIFLDNNPPDVRYLSYYVTAVDMVGNESEASQEHIIMLKTR